jgi:hypothetical protein
MNSHRKIRAGAGWICGSLCALVLLGCDSSTESLLAVRGRVTYRSSALTAGTIVFTPDPQRGAAGPIARGELESDGTYQVWTDDKPGAAAGWYRVTVVALEPNLTGSVDTARLPHSLLPDRYRDPELSGLACEVKVGQDNHIDFELQ